MNTYNICPHCWRGNIRGGCCDACGRPMESARKPDALPLWSQLENRFLVGEVLGQGGFGITYSAWDEKNNRRVALKELYPKAIAYRGQDRQHMVPMAGQAEFLAELRSKFEREANLLLQLQGQDHLIRVYSLFQSNNTVYYTMEFLEGQDLEAYRKKCGIFSWETLAPLMQQTLEALGGLHRKNLIHRDISPDNLFLTRDNEIRLIDFGSVRAYQGNNHFTTHLKKEFAPWEQNISNGDQGPWTDIYSLSVTMYLLLTGRFPPKAPERKGGEPTVPIRTLAPQVPEYVARAIEKGMAVEIRDRFRSTDEFMRALEMSPTTGNRAPAATVSTTNAGGWIQGAAGVYAGRSSPLEQNKELLLGRNPECWIRFPEGTQGVSRRQCSIFLARDGRLFVRDAGSSYGTFLNRQRLGRDWQAVQWGSTLWFGNEAFRFVNR